MERRSKTGTSLLNRSTQKAIHRKLMGWFATSRRNYPWRTTQNWFHLIMAELMLRRTRSDQVASVYESFTKKYRNASQANLDPDGVQEELRSLGLNWRNEQILQTIQFLSHTFGSRRRLQATVDLTETPGIGDYCNAMVRSKLFQDTLPAIDSNIARIYCRLTDVKFHPEMRRKAWLRQLAADFMQTATASSSNNDPFEINLALLDLAALVCKPSAPRCIECPIQKHCKTGQKKL
ncbi:MAG TPA: hypothetical protein DEA96_15550 [Leptospiraceae bacterium]|nr:hypothetical protein [Spirochaetaceae bacterium]HBS06383.1 hypothetical protein [Leptospiraceae bacterium]|tara:strand:+ start:20732 stop:21436 length:705 start_codon:yes stop_codon:yes gene_type:complete